VENDDSDLLNKGTAGSVEKMVAFNLILLCFGAQINKNKNAQPI
jgi:hypothetical protein